MTRLEGTLNTNSVRNAQGLWINSQVFREVGVDYMKNGYYCPEPRGSSGYGDFWDTELKRCTEGYTSGGAKITQHHYFYLNYAPINLIDAKTGEIVATKERKLPDFWDGDYNYFWAVEIARNGLFNRTSLAPSTQAEKDEFQTLNRAYKKFLDEPDDLFNLQENSDKRITLEERVLDRLNLYYTIEIDWRDGGHHLVVGKARRKGYSYKNAALCANIYNTVRESTTIIGAFDKKYLYPEGTMAMSDFYLSHLNDKTAFAKAREYIDKQEHKKASFTEMKNGIKVEAGYRSQIMALTFQDNPEAARGKDPYLVLWEESGNFPNLLDCIRKTGPGLTAGDYMTGQMIAFGTGGDMKKGTAGFAKVFYKPKQDNFMSFKNIWDEDASNSFCSFFHPVTWNMEGHYDEQGNSNLITADRAAERKRDSIIKNSTDSGAIQQYVQEFCKTPSEAFLMTSMNDFPIIELRNQLAKVNGEGLHKKYGQPCYLYNDFENGRIKADPDLTGKLEVLWDYKPSTPNLTGAVVIYEHPPSHGISKGLYKISYDPYRQVSSSDTMPSLGAIYVYKSHNRLGGKSGELVASYIGRPRTPDDINRIAELLAELYNAEIMYENEVTHVKDYFTRIKKLHLLSLQPDTVIATATMNSKVKRVYGCHMSEKMKDAGEKYIKQWLLEVKDIDEDGKEILNLQTILDPGLLEELIDYNREGNFDRVMSFMMLMFQLAEDSADKIYTNSEESLKAKQAEIDKFIRNQFSNRRELLNV